MFRHDNSSRAGNPVDLSILIDIDPADPFDFF
jgi:hypothetical protein